MVKAHMDAVAVMNPYFRSGLCFTKLLTFQHPELLTVLLVLFDGGVSPVTL